MKKLKIWNGRGWGHRQYGKDNRIIPDPIGIKYCDHAYVCAYSRAHAVRLINQAVGYDVVSDNELKTYWNEGCWGDRMDGITQEVGVWTAQEVWGDKPKRIL